MSYTLVETTEALAQMGDRLQGTRRIALDCEAAGFHRYSDRLCLVQLSTEDSTYLLDPLALDLSEVLRPVLEDEGVEVVMHGADFDLRLMDRDLKAMRDAEKRKKEEKKSSRCPKPHRGILQKSDSLPCRPRRSKNSSRGTGCRS